MLKPIKDEDVGKIGNRTLNVIVPEIIAPYVNRLEYAEEADQRYKYGVGIVFEILRQMATLLNLTYKVDLINAEGRSIFDEAFKMLEDEENVSISNLSVSIASQSCQDGFFRIMSSLLEVHFSPTTRIAMRCSLGRFIMRRPAFSTNAPPSTCFRLDQMRNFHEF